eukprot:m.1447477 g.1447477  ORF g.1447477 m.1447477 type:complete len:308 (+) comp25107_c0_seq126:144-1067(+)
MAAFADGDYVQHATSRTLPRWASATERTLALLLAAQATQKYIPKSWIGIFFGRIITEPFAALIKAKHLMRCTCLSSAAVLALDGIHGEGIAHPFVYKVMHSAGYKRREGKKWMDSLQQGRYNDACEHLHPGHSCTQALSTGIPRVFRVALRDVGFLYALLLLRSMATGGRRPGVLPPLRTLSFCVTAFSTIRVLSCAACHACRRVPLLNNHVVVTAVLPVWFSFCMLWTRMESRQRQRQIAAFSLAAAVPAVLRALRLWPDSRAIHAVVTAWLHPTVRLGTKRIALYLLQLRGSFPPDGHSVDSRTA